MSVPYDLLCKLHLAALAPDASEPPDKPANPRSWVYASSVSSWTAGFSKLQENGLVETGYDDDDRLAVRLTPQGLKVAEDRITSPNVREARTVEREQEEVAKSVHTYSQMPLWGKF